MKGMLNNCVQAAGEKGWSERIVFGGAGAGALMDLKMLWSADA